MERWQSMYLIVWAAFFQIVFVLFSPFGDTVSLGVHSVLALVILALAFVNFRDVRKTSCPDRIKRITKVTWYLAVLQVVLGLVLAAGVMLSWGSVFVEFMSFLHVVVALAIITQASSSATAYDMWEEKEFGAPAPAPSVPS